MHDGCARAISKCPNCREPVSPFAAGCAICGTNLEAARAELAAKRGRRPQLPGAVRLSDDALRIGLGVLTALFSPVMGALLTGYFAHDAEQDGRVQARNLMLMWGGLFLGF